MAKPLPVTVIVVDPETRTCRRQVITPSVRVIKRLVRTISNNLGWRRLLEDLDGEILFVACRADMDPEKPVKEWRIRGGVNTAGRGVLFGSFNRSTDGMWDVPKSVDDAWLAKRIVWCEPGEVAPAAEVLEVGNACTRCNAAPVVFEPDGDRLCQSCADGWVRSEGEAAADDPAAP